MPTMNRFLYGSLLFVLLVGLLDGTFGCASEPKTGEPPREAVTEFKRPTEPTTDAPGSEPKGTETQAEPAVKEVPAEPPRDAGTTEPADEQRADTMDAGQDEVPMPEREAVAEGSSERTAEAVVEKKPEVGPEKKPTFFLFEGQTLKFTDPNQGPYADVKVCAHSSAADVSLGKPLAGTTCAITPKDGKYSIQSIPYNKLVYLSFRSNGPKSGSKDLLPTMFAIRILTPGSVSLHLGRVRTELVDKTEAVQIAKLLQSSLDLTKNGALIADVHTQRIKTVSGVTMTLHPNQPSGVTGPIYMPATFPGRPSTTGTTTAGLALFLNVPAGSYAVSYTKQSVPACRAYPSSPSTIKPCRAGATAGKNDCSAIDVLVGWLSITSGTCP